MAIPVLIMGKSGSGKTTSLRNCQDFGMFNVSKKPLPFRNPPKMVNSDDYNVIMATLAKCKALSIAIDDSGYLMTNMFMRGHSVDVKGNAVFQLYNIIADSFWNLIEFSKQLDNDKIIYFIMHVDVDDNGNVKPKSIGKLLDEKVCIEGLFSIVLHAKYEDGKYIFSTNTNGYDVAKSPLEMFPPIIDNDLDKVDNVIREYYGLKPRKEKKEEENNAKTE